MKFAIHRAMHDFIKDTILRFDLSVELDAPRIVKYNLKNKNFSLLTFTKKCDTICRCEGVARALCVTSQHPGLSVWLVLICETQVC